MIAAAPGPRWLARALATLAGVLPTALPAGDATAWTIDGASSEARFRVRLFGVVPLNGRFDAFHGALRVDDAAQRATVEATLEAASVRMRNPRNADWVRSPEFFDAARHPLIRFVADGVPLALLHTGGALAGELTLRGVTRAVSFTVAPRACDVAAAASCELDVAGHIDRSDFDMTTRRGVLSDRVSLRFRIVARRAT